jgi:hypothetical protein
MGVKDVGWRESKSKNDAKFTLPHNTLSLDNELVVSRLNVYDANTLLLLNLLFRKPRSPFTQEVVKRQQVISRMW